MDLSVVVSTLNDRDRLVPSLDALAERVPGDTEIVVVNGPSADGTTGVVRDRDDVDVLVEISDRSVSVSRNAGIEVATGGTIAFLEGGLVVERDWYGALAESIDAGARVVTGPVIDGTGSVGEDGPPTDPIGRVLAGENAAFDRSALDAVDGFDEYLDRESDRDCADRLEAVDVDVNWNDGLAVRATVGTDGGRNGAEWGNRYRANGYRLAKNVGPRPSVFLRTLGSALTDAIASGRRVVAGDGDLSTWLSDGGKVVRGSIRGLADGLRARYADRSDRRNPNGLSSRRDRAVARYDRRA